MTEPTLTPDRDALVHCVTAHRPDIDEDDLRGAILALEQAGWPWARIHRDVHAMVQRGEEPRDLRAAITHKTRWIR